MQFRAWNPKKKRFEDEYDYLFLSSEGDLYIRDDHTDCLVLVNYIIQFATGVKDRNGKMIYEGDRIHIIEENYECEAIIVFKNGAFVYETDNMFYHGEQIDPSIDMEVIGHVYDKE